MQPNLMEMLSPIALLDRRVVGLKGVLGSTERLAVALAVGPDTIRNWELGERRPHLSSEHLIDELRFAVVALLESGLQPAEAKQWFESVNAELDRKRPVEVFAQRPRDVMELAAKAAVQNARQALSPTDAAAIEAAGRAEDDAFLDGVRP